MQPRWPPDRNRADERPARRGEAASPDAEGLAIAPRMRPLPPGPIRIEPRVPPPTIRKRRGPTFDGRRMGGRQFLRLARCLQGSTAPRTSFWTAGKPMLRWSAGTPRRAAPFAPRNTTGTPAQTGARAGWTTPRARARGPGGSRPEMSPVGTGGKPAVDRRCLPLRPRREETYLRAPCGRGGIGRHARFRIWCRKAWGFESLRPHSVPYTSTTTWKSPRRTSTR